MVFHKIATLARPWGLIGGPWECRVGSFGALGASWGLIQAPGGLLGALLNPTAKKPYNPNVDRSNKYVKTNGISTFS